MEKENSVYVFNYKEQTIWKVASLLWFVVALIFTSILVFSTILEKPLYPFALQIVPLIFLPIGLGIFYSRITGVSYVIISDTGVSIYQGMVRKRKDVLFSQIVQGRIIRNKLILVLVDKKEVTINLDLLTVTDADELLRILSNNITVKKGF